MILLFLIKQTIHCACRRSPAVSFASTSHHAGLTVIQFTNYCNTRASIVIPDPATLLAFSGSYFCAVPSILHTPEPSPVEALMLNSALPFPGFRVRTAPGFTYCAAATGSVMVTINKANSFLFIN